MNKKYIRILAEMAIVLSAAGIMTSCVNSKVEDISSSQTDIIITTDSETTIDETTTDEIIADSSSNIESNSLNESSLNESSKCDNSVFGDDDSSEIYNSNNIQDNIEVAQNSYPIIVVETEPQLSASVTEQTPVLVEETPTEIGESIEDEPVVAESAYEPYDLYNQGRLYYGDYQYTWYSERVLPGYGLAIDGRHTDADGFVCDGDGYICVAASSLSKGAVIDTPFGRQGKVYDSGCAWGTIDVYVNW